MTSQIELISDGDGLAVIGDPVAVDLFLAAEQLPSKNLDLPRISSVFGAGAASLQTGSELAANTGRWVKLSPQSAATIKKYGLRESSKSGLKTGVVKGAKGRVKGYVEFVNAPGASVTNPAVLAGAGIMAQLAMQQTMAEVTDYLARIDEKLDDVLRAQKDAVVAQMIGVGLLIDEAMILRSYVGRINEVTWSKIQATAGTIADTQAYALLQLEGLAKKLEDKSKIGDLAKATKEAAPKVREWLAVLARCFQLLDGIAVIELDRVLDAAPEDIDGYRLGLKAARAERRAAIARRTDRLLTRLGEAASLANDKVLLHPSASPEVVQAAGRTASAIDDFHELLGIETTRAAVEARRWATAATEARERALAAGADRVGVARQLGSEARNKAASTGGRITGRLGERAQRWRARSEDRDEES